MRTPDYENAATKAAEILKNFLDYESFLSQTDESMIANFGTYMDGYEE